MEQLKLSNGTFQSQSACVARTRLQGFACSAMDVSKQKSQRPGHLRPLVHLEELPRETSQVVHVDVNGFVRQKKRCEWILAR